LSRPRVLVVRSGANPFVSLDGSAAVEVVERVSHSIEPVEPPEEEFVAPADLAIFTSQVAVERVTGDPRLLSQFSQATSGARLAAVGPVTAEALRRHGIEPALVAAGSGEALLELLPERLEGCRVLFPCGEDAAPELPDGLRRRGASVRRAVVYRKVPRHRDAALEREILERPFAAFCATSPSAAQWLFEGLGESAADRLRATPAVVLGRFTRRFLEARGVGRISVAGEQRFSSALSLLEELATTAARA
jgi:uroporphyrinogen-III synthase